MGHLIFYGGKVNYIGPRGYGVADDGDSHNDPRVNFDASRCSPIYREV